MIPYIAGNIGDVIELESGQHWSASRMRIEIASRTAALVSLGVGPGDNVMLVHGNNASFFADLIAVWEVGACAVCLDDNVGLSEFVTLFKTCKPKISVVKGGVPAKLASLESASVTFVDTDELGNNVGCISSSASVPLMPDMDSPALILFTSGTTGEPKGVVHTFRTLLTKWEILQKHVPLGYLDVSLCLLPTHFGHGLICNCLYPLLYGKTLVISPKFNLPVLSKLGSIIDDHKVTYMSSVPAVWKAALATSLEPVRSTLNLVTCGSAPLGQGLWTDIQLWSGIKRVWNTYGITELGSWIAGTGLNDVEPMDGLTGIGWGSKFMITRSGSDGGTDVSTTVNLEVLSAGESGHIWVQSPTLMAGYYNRPALTAEVVYGSWFYTGDIGYLNGDGMLVLSGRVRNEINYGGIKVIPEDVDLVLERHEAILEACSFAQDDQMSGQVVATAVVLREGQSPPTSANLKAWSRQYLSDYKVPTVWYAVAEIPKSSRGKVIRTQIAEFCANLPKMR